jgi:predicted exporter
VIALGETDAQALASHGTVARQLDAAVASGELGAHRGVATLLPSPETQRAVSTCVRSDADLPSRFVRVFEEEGFARNAFAPFLASLDEPGVAPLTYEDLASSQAAALVRPFRVHLGDRIAYLSFLHDVKRPEAIAARLEGLPNTLFLRQSDLWKEAQLQYQTSTAKLLSGGLLAVFALLAGRYREPRRTLIAFVPSLLAAGVTVSVLALSGRGLDLISLTALLFVVSMGVDYSVFLVDADGRDGGDGDREGGADRESQAKEPDAHTCAKSRAAALTGALLAGSSTVIAFGLLALSPHPVLSGLGLTAAVGIAASLVLAPTVLLLLRPNSIETPEAP